MKKIIPCIMAGGSGTRLWPISRKSYPKQFLNIFGEKSLFQQTCLRVNNELFTPPIILGNEEHRFIIAEQLRQINMPVKEIILEPLQRNTAPTVLIASLIAADIEEDALLLIMPSDQIISNQNVLLNSIKLGIDSAINNKIVVFGIKPDKPHTGYGYIKTTQLEGDILNVEKFIEKPPLEMAEKYYNDKKYFWNSGIFLFSAKRMINEYKNILPNMLIHCKNSINNSKRDLDFLRIDKKSYEKCQNISLDYAIIEKTNEIVCVPLNTYWSDLGSWTAIAEQFKTDNDGNAKYGNVLFKNSKNCFAYSMDSSSISLNGVNDLIIVSTKDAILVTSKDKAQEVGDIVNLWRKLGSESVDHHLKVHRPWGWYECLQKGDRFQVKRLMVKPKAKLSLQSHRYRSEHWVVIEGSLKATINGSVYNLSVNESVFIPIGAKHRLENPTDKPAYIIEVQTGDYLGEDDIIRYEDIYKRK